MRVGYFFITNKINKREVKIIYCPTDKIIANYSSKLTQGNVFEFQRNTILGIKKDNFVTYKDWYKFVLRKYELWDVAEHDLYSI